MSTIARLRSPFTEMASPLSSSKNGAFWTYFSPNCHSFVMERLLTIFFWVFGSPETTSLLVYVEIQVKMCWSLMMTFSKNHCPFSPNFASFYRIPIVWIVSRLQLLHNFYLVREQLQIQSENIPHRRFTDAQSLSTACSRKIGSLSKGYCAMVMFALKRDLSD